MKRTVLTVTAFVICFSMLLCVFSGCTKIEKDNGKETGSEKTETSAGEAEPGKDVSGEAEVTTAGGDEVTTTAPAGNDEATPGTDGGQGNTEVTDTAAGTTYPEGITVSEYNMIYLAETYNIEVKISNSTGSDVYVDFSKLSLKLNNERELDEHFAKVKIGTGTDISCSMPIEGDTSDFTKDSYFTVFYNGQFVGRASMEYYG